MAQTVHINIPNPASVFNEVYVPFIKGEVHKPLVILEGGRGSGKSFSMAQKKVLEMLRRKHRTAFIRKVAETLRDSIYREMEDTVKRWKLEQYFTFLTSPLSIRCASGSEGIFKGLDKSEKIKSLANVDDVVIEEATELTKDDYTTLRYTIRGKTQDEEVKQIVLLFNRTAGHWTEEYFNASGEFREQDHIYHLHTTFQDNKFLDEHFLSDLASLKTQDPELYRKVALGFPVALKGLVYTNWDIVFDFPEDVQTIVYGLDFGYNDPMVLSKVAIGDADVWIDECYYETKKTTSDLIRALPGLLHKPTAEIWADSAEPDRIEEIYKAGFNIKPVEKNKDSVLNGIDTLKRFRMHLTARSVKTRKDFESYKWKEDKFGLLLDEPEPQHQFSHGPDSVRYPVWMVRGKGMKPVTVQDFVKLQKTAPIERRSDWPAQQQEVLPQFPTVFDIKGF